MRGSSAFAALGSAGAAIAAGVCCLGAPLAAGGMIGAAGLGFALEPLRPIFLVLAAALLALGLRLARRRGPCDADTCQPRPDPAKRSARVLWIATGIAIVFASVPLWIDMVR